MKKDLIEKIIKKCILEADKSRKRGDSPFGAILTDKYGNLICSANNSARTNLNPTAHAEIKLLTKAAKKLGTKDLSGYVLFSNAESCPMCMSAAVTAKITNFYFGAPSEKRMDPYITVFEIAQKSKNKIKIKSGILKEECEKHIVMTRKEVVN